MKDEVWLRANWRVPAVLACAPALTLILGITVAARAESPAERGLGMALIAMSAAGLAYLSWRAQRPRLAYGRGELAVYLAGSRPIRVPIDIVECFFLGQGPSMLPVPSVGGTRSGVETATLVVRLAERAAQWQHRDVRPRCGLWCESYITIRGTCCEKLDGQLVARLNQRLVEAHRESKAASRTH